MRKHWQRGSSWLRGHVMTVLLIGAVSGVFGIASIWSIRMPSAAAIVAALVPDGDDVRSGMQRVGLGAESLVAAGATSGDIATIVGDATTYMLANYPSMLSADTNASDARTRVGHYTRLVQSGTRDQDTVNALATAKSDLATAEGDQQTLLDGLFNAATASLEQSEVGTLSLLRSRPGWTMPIQYLCVGRTDADLLELRNAVAHKRIADESGEAVDQAVQALLTSCDGQTEVVVAKTALDTHLASVRTALASELSF